MSVKARCLNYTGCLLAYRGEVIEIAQNAPLVCPECGKTVSVTQSKGGNIGKLVAGVVILAAIAAACYFGYPLVKGFISPKPEPPGPEPIVEVPPTTPAPVDPRPNPVVNNNKVPPVQIATPLPLSTPQAGFNGDLNNNKANQRVRDEVLKRIDTIPRLTQANKDKLYNSVQRAKSMGLVITIPFTSGGRNLPGDEIPLLKAQLDKPEIMKLREDPTYVFVVLGYADPKGDEKQNIELSRARADSVLVAMRDKCGVNNVMHAVAMGGSKLMDAENLEKNRVVEVWAVLP